MSNEDLDQDAMAAAWGAALDDTDEIEAESFDGLDSEMAAQWAAMVGEPDVDGASEKAGNERILNQDEIDSLLGFDLDERSLNDTSGLRAIINSAMVSYERLPMLEVVYDRLVRLLTTSLRNFTSDNVEVSLDNITSMRFGDYLNSIPLPAMLAVYRAVQWDNLALITIDSGLIYGIVDILLGGRSSPAVRVEGRPYTTIETTLVSRMVEVILKDSETAFQPLSPVKFELERLETNPRFATIARPANAAILVRLRIDMEDRGGRVEILLPYSTIEPIRHLLLQGFMGEKFGRDPIWEGHLANEIWNTEVPIDVVLDEFEVPLGRILNLKVGETLPMTRGKDDAVVLKSSGINLSRGFVGQSNGKVALKLKSGLSRDVGKADIPGIG
ncbi:MAG: flagellar motor switch protein FliM [Rhodomicrobium sp.]|nr:MAG: flagellar motor switch protein FliM [Rhodomicrobium sp.]